MKISAIDVYNADDFDFSGYVEHESLVVVSRAPIPIETFGNITTPFSLNIWILVVLSILALSSSMLAMYLVYSHQKQMDFLICKENTMSNFLFLLVKITEPDPIPWFPKFSAGKGLVLLWSVFTFFVIAFYSSNLRSHIVAIEYEKPLATLNDVLLNGKRLWIFDDFPYLE